MISKWLTYIVSLLWFSCAYAQGLTGTNIGGGFPPLGVTTDENTTNITRPRLLIFENNTLTNNNNGSVSIKYGAINNATYLTPSVANSTYYKLDGTNTNGYFYFAANSFFRLVGANVELWIGGVKFDSWGTPVVYSAIVFNSQLVDFDGNGLQF